MLKIYAPQGQNVTQTSLRERAKGVYVQSTQIGYIRSKAWKKKKY